ncbi:MAG: methylated-DNA--[protein]-cysteine S-methyltransferase [Clostridia bacterium]
MKTSSGKDNINAGDPVFWLSRLETPLGPMVAGVHGGRLCLLDFADKKTLESEIKKLEILFNTRSGLGMDPLHIKLEEQLADYFKGNLTTFNLDFEIPGTDFQQAVWKSLLDIPYGQTRSYGEQAISLGKPTATRAVARANGQNRLAIVVPCHRVIGADGSLTGYGGGLDRKRFLIDLESRLS